MTNRKNATQNVVMRKISREGTLKIWNAIVRAVIPAAHFPIMFELRINLELLIMYTAKRAINKYLIVKNMKNHNGN